MSGSRCVEWLPDELPARSGGRFPWFASRRRLTDLGHGSRPAVVQRLQLRQTGLVDVLDRLLAGDLGAVFGSPDLGLGCGSGSGSGSGGLGVGSGCGDLGVAARSRDTGVGYGDDRSRNSGDRLRLRASAHMDSYRQPWDTA